MTLAPTLESTDSPLGRDSDGVAQDTTPTKSDVQRGKPWWRLW
jgi:hypothetical protein